jgi:methylenetetrahydrofolate reductase (NADPH)
LDFQASSGAAEGQNRLRAGRGARVFLTWHYFHYADLCREQGGDVPIIPGLKILTSEKQLSSIPRSFYVEVPAELADEVMANPQHVVDIGVEWAVKQTQELLDRGVPSVHFYVMQSAGAIKKLMAKLKL